MTTVDRRRAVPADPVHEQIDRAEDVPMPAPAAADAGRGATITPYTGRLVVAVLSVLAALALSALLRLSGSMSLAQQLVAVAVFLVLGQLAWWGFTLLRGRDRRTLDVLRNEQALTERAFAERDALSTRLEHLAMHDTLTGLPNRVMFQERLHQALSEQGVEQTLGVLFIDLDDFKIVNDSLGHAAGDELLVGVGLRLENALRTGDVVARFGGDEFAVLLCGGGTAEQANGVARRLLGVLRAPFVLSAGMASGQGSGGLVVRLPDPERSPQEQAADLMRQADLAMYAAKAAGGGGVVEFRNEMQHRMLERLTLQDEMTQALISDDFRLAYQPVVDLDTGQLTCVEALARWHHPTRGDIPPTEFIPVAEESGAIVALGLWVLEQACRDLNAWDEKFPGNDIRVAVNVSARQLRESSVGPQIARVLHRGGIDPRRLVLEVTESLLMDDGEAAAATLWQLRGLGIRIAVDDFGTGYSSLSRLVDLPLDDLKIDRSFVAELERSGAGATIINAAVAMAHGLGLKVIAEGVEDTDQLDFLLAVGCDCAQGYLFSRPVPAAEITDMLAQGERLTAPRDQVAPPLLGGVSHLLARPSATILPPVLRHR